MIGMRMEPATSWSLLSIWSPETADSGFTIRTGQAAKRAFLFRVSRIAELPRIVFPRMRSAANPGVTYTVESSIDEITWTPLATWEYSEQVLRSEGDWDEVEVIVLDRSPVQEFYRIRLDLESPLAS